MYVPVIYAAASMSLLMTVSRHRAELKNPGLKAKLNCNKTFHYKPKRTRN